MGVSTSTTAFLGRAQKGPVNDPTLIHSYGDYERIFGGLWYLSTMSYAVQQFFQNGGTDAVIVRLNNKGTKAQFKLPPDLVLEAKNEGAWANSMQISIDTAKTQDPTSTNLFNVSITLLKDDKKTIITREQFLNVTVGVNDPRYIRKVLSEESGLVQLSGEPNPKLPTKRPNPIPDEKAVFPIPTGSDGVDLTRIEYLGSEDLKTGIYALEKADIFNLLCIPPYKFGIDVEPEVLSPALEYCKRRRAFFILDPPSGWVDKSKAEDGIDKFRKPLGSLNYGAVYFPMAMIADPLQENRIEDFVPCGIVAGIYARTDAQRGVWKAPAGTETGMSGVQGLKVPLTDRENGDLNPLGVNCFRNFVGYPFLVWGARTLEGADRMASEWKYIPIRRLALYIEESLFRGTKWVVFEPNDEPLWSQIRLNVGAFMHSLFRQGAFQGRSPREAYFVKCDEDTTTQNDRNSGIVNILVGFAPLKPAEFVVIKIQQMAGKIET